MWEFADAQPDDASIREHFARKTGNTGALRTPRRFVPRPPAQFENSSDGDPGRTASLPSMGVKAAERGADPGDLRVGLGRGRRIDLG